MNKEKNKVLKRSRRKNKIRFKINGTKECQRLSVFKSSLSMFVQLIDDEAGKTIVSAHSREIKLAKGDLKEGEGKKITTSFALGKLLAEKALVKKIDLVVFDRGGYKYHGRIKAVAEGARAGGLKF